MKLVFVLSSFLLTTYIHAQQTTIAVHFLYGSKPAKGYKEEKKWFGGIKGGHVTIEKGDSIIGFQPKGTCHVFGKRENANGYFSAKQKQKWEKDTVSLKYATILIPLDDAHYAQLKTTLDNYLQKSPYDYAVFGMRCAAATYDILEDAGVVKKRSRMGKWVTFFYPQLLRRRMLKIADTNNYTVIRTGGRTSRVWEKE